MQATHREHRFIGLILCFATVAMVNGCSVSGSDEAETIELRLENEMEGAFDRFLGAGNYEYSYAIEERSTKQHKISESDRERIKGMSGAALRLSTETLTFSLTIEVTSEVDLNGCEKLIDNKPSCAFCRELRKQAVSGKIPAGTKIEYSGSRYVEDHLDRDLEVGGRNFGRYSGRFFGYC